MTFPNAKYGVKKIFAAEILNLISIFAGIMTIVFAYFMTKSVDSTGKVISEGEAVAGLGGVAIFGLAMTVLSIIAIIFTIMGTKRGSIDEPAFKMAFYLVIASLVVAVVEGMVTSFVDNKILSNIFSIASDVIDVLITVYIILAIMSLAAKLGNTEMVLKGATIYKIIIGVYVLQIIAKIISAIFGSGKASEAISGALLIVASVLAIIQYILYLLYLSKAKKMLEA